MYDKDIPYIAKIVNLADSFDAMTTDRPYRHRRPAIDVIEDLKRNSGKQFAPELVSALLKGMFRELTGDATEKRFRKLLGREYMESETILPMVQSALNGAAPKPLSVLSVD